MTGRNRISPGILVLGNVNVDLVLGEIDGWPAVGTEIEVERSEMRAGGSAGNTALALSGLGLPHLLVASVGDDPYGHWLRRQFDTASCDWLPDAGGTTVTVGIVHRGGDRAFFTTPGHLRRAKAVDLRQRIPAAPSAGACAIISGGFLMPDIMEGTADLLGLLKKMGWRTAIDPGWPTVGWAPHCRKLMAEWLRLADIALINDEEACAFGGADELGSAIDNIQAMQPGGALLVIKSGARGAVAACGDNRYEAAAPTVEVVDTVGAGDSFNAAFLGATARGCAVEPALRAGVDCASRAISTYPRRYR